MKSHQGPKDIVNASEAQYVRAGWLVDGRGGPAQKDMVLVLRGGRIVSVKPWHSDMPISLDLSGSTVLPPLMDVHVHLVFSGTLDAQKRSAQLAQTSVQAHAAILRHLADHWRHGVIAVRDGGDRNGNVLRCKRQHPFTCDRRVHVASPGWAWHTKDRYGAMIGRWPAEGLTLAQAVVANMDVIDHLKIIQSGLNSIDRFGQQGPAQFSEEELRAAVKVAHAAHRPVMIHANGELAVRTAIEAGCDSIEHGYFMGTDNLRRMADKGTFWVPTVIPMAALAQAPAVTADQRDVARRTVNHQLEQIRKAHELGVAIALGTDAGSQGADHGVSVQEELKLLSSAGLSVEAAICCATVTAARLMGLDDWCQLLPGGRADFITLSSEPWALPDKLSSIGPVWLNGQPCRSP